MSESFILNFKVPEGGEKSGSLNCFGLLQHVNRTILQLFLVLLGNSRVWRIWLSYES